MRNKRAVLPAAIIAALGGFLFGFDTVVISGAEQDIQKLFDLDGFWLGFTVAIALIGTVIGAMFAGKPSDLFGRKKILFVIAVLYAVSAAGSGLADSWIVFLIFRFLGGLGIGASSVVGPMYISEISPSNIRGRLVMLFQINIVLGILVSFLSNYLLAGFGGEDAWRWMLGVEFFPAVIFFFLLFLIPESPRWLVMKNRVPEASEVLNNIGEENIDSEINDVIESLEEEKESKKHNLFSAEYKLPIMFAVMLALFNQFSGINALLYYAPRIFEMSGLADDSALLQSVTIGITNLIFTLIAFMLIDKFGRKTLLVIGSIGMFFSLGMVSYTFYTQQFGTYDVLIYLIAFIAFFAFSQGAVIWVYLSEIFPNKVRAKGQALGSFTHWIAATFISWMFPLVAESPVLGGGPSFLFFSVMMLLQLFFVSKYLPETKGKSLEEIGKEIHSLKKIKVLAQQD